MIYIFNDICFKHLRTMYVNNTTFTYIYYLLFTKNMGKNISKKKLKSFIE